MVDISAKLKHNLVREVIRELLEDAGYGVVPAGDQSVLRLRKVAEASGRPWDRSNVPARLAYTPDFEVTDRGGARSGVEVKYRTILHDGLITDVRRQATNYGDFTLVLALGSVARDTKVKSLSDVVRCCRIRGGRDVGFSPAGPVQALDALPSRASGLWDKMVPLKEAFDAAQECDGATLAMITSVLRALSLYAIATRRLQRLAA